VSALDPPPEGFGGSAGWRGNLAVGLGQRIGHFLDYLASVMFWGMEFASPELMRVGGLAATRAWFRESLWSWWMAQT
jgi:hypothetical protein